ncbi:MAG: DNA ligase-associated DEXH box helicase [Sphingobacteriales bacterium]|nr:MAG: DNA ligase-associated DEXH box helicase [Sphingobacteriales bacterium]
MALIEFTKRGIYCKQGDFYVDPWWPVDYAVTTHGHSDHVRFGNKHYLCHTLTKPIIKRRISEDLDVETLNYGESIVRNGVNISFYPAGHIIGSAQVRLEYKGEVCVISGDYKTEDDGISDVFEPVKCHSFVSESTFGLPVYRITPETTKDELQKGIVIVPPAMRDSRWIKNLSHPVTGICSGWMQVRAHRRWQSADAGFALSDHADWTGLMDAITATGAQKVYVTHGFTAAFSRFLNDEGIESEEVMTKFGQEDDEENKVDLADTETHNSETKNQKSE